MARWTEEEIEEHIRTGFVYEIILNRKFYYELDFPPNSFFTPEIIRSIKNIPDEELVYSDKDIERIHRILENLDYMDDNAKNLDLKNILEDNTQRRKWLKSELENYEAD